jgi:hypothetical protein
MQWILNRKVKIILQILITKKEKLRTQQINIRKTMNRSRTTLKTHKNKKDHQGRPKICFTNKTMKKFSRKSKIYFYRQLMGIESTVKTNNRLKKIQLIKIWKKALKIIKYKKQRRTIVYEIFGIILQSSGLKCLWNMT